jgi:DNA-binding MarR family transcriptional regulator
MYDLRKKFIEMVNRFNKLDSLEYQFLFDEKIKHMEIHTLEHMDNNPNKKVSDLAGDLGITKGALSQQVKKFEKRGLINRVRYNDNFKEVYIKLTKKGKNVVKIHDEYEKYIFNDFWALFDSKSEEEKVVLHVLLDELIRIFTEAEEKVLRRW